jgi:microcin C transport system permease protein
MRMALAGADGAGEGGSGGDARLQLDIPEKQLELLRQYYGFDKPLPVAYGTWLLDTVQLDLGTSFRYNEPVLQVIADRLPVSIYYGLITAIFTYGICIPLGILKAIRHRTAIDTWTSVFIFIGYAVPGFALGAVLSNLLAVRWEFFPLGGFMAAGADALPWHERWASVVWHSVLPLVAYLAGAFAVTTMLMKNSLLENMSADYVKTALAKGLSWRAPCSCTRCATRSSRWPPPWAGCWASSSPAASSSSACSTSRASGCSPSRPSRRATSPSCWASSSSRACC